VEAAFNSLQVTPLGTSCSDLTPAKVTLNGESAAAVYLSCAAVMAGNPPPRLMVMPSNSNSFEHDATLVAPHDYLIGDSSGYVYDYTVGESTLRWSLQLKGGQIS